MLAKGFFNWIRFSVFYKSFSMLLELMMVYQIIEKRMQWKNHFTYSLLYIPETGRVSLYKLKKYFV